MSELTGIPFSTLSKVEHNRLTLTYDKLTVISERLGMPLADLLSNTEVPPPSQITGRKSIGTIETSIAIVTPNYDYYYLSPDLRGKKMIPIISRIKARTLDEFGDLIRHGGEEFIYVIDGEIDVHTEFYEPFRLAAGQSVYIDSAMGHAYVAVGASGEALVLCVCSTSQEELIATAEAAYPDMLPVRLSEIAAPHRSNPLTSSARNAGRRRIGSPDQ